MEPLVSVIVPAYNYEPWVAAAIESALAQDYPGDRLEVIAVDDGSTDGTPGVLASFGDAIRVIRRPNGGLNAATETGVLAARGELITFLDADDAWPADRIRLLVDALIANPQAGVAYGDMLVRDEAGNVIHASFNAHKGLAQPPSGRFLGRLLSFNCVSAGSLMVRASLRERFTPIPEFAAWNDWWIATQVLRVADIVAIPGIVNLYRQHSENMNIGGDEAQRIKLLRAELPFRRWLLATLEPREVALPDVLRGLQTYDWAVANVAGADGLTVEQAAPSSELELAQSGAAMAAARSALEAGDLEAASTLLVRAAALWPAWPEPRALLDATLSFAREPHGEPPATRGLVGFALVDEVLGAPDLLTAWAGAYGADDDATLVIGGVSDEPSTHALVALVEALGLGGDDAADLVAIAERDPSLAAARLGRRTDVALRPAGIGWPSVPAWAATPARRAG